MREDIFREVGKDLIRVASNVFGGVQATDVTFLLQRKHIKEDSERPIGCGGYGKVFKGRYKGRSDDIICIKKFNLQKHSFQVR